MLGLDMCQAERLHPDESFPLLAVSLAGSSPQTPGHPQRTGQRVWGGRSGAHPPLLRCQENRLEITEVQLCHVFAAVFTKSLAHQTQKELLIF